MSGATVRATNTETSEIHATQTDTQGAFLFPALAAGRYRVEAEATGFKRLVHDGISLSVNQNARVDFALEVGSLSQEVRVTADAPLVDTRQAQLGGTVDRERVVDLPLNGRNVYSLVSILPGVSRANTIVTGNNEGNYANVNGSRQRQTNFLFPTAPLGMLFPGDPGVPQAVIPTIWTNFAPRLGPAWDPSGNGKTAVRAGWGIFYK